VLIEVNTTLRLGDTLLPLILRSDRTHLSDVAGNNNEWLFYMTIGNLTSKIRQLPSTHTVVIVTLMEIPITNIIIPQKQQDEQQQTNREVPNIVLWRALQPLTLKQHPNTHSWFHNIL
jgi:hypothetical protein